MYQLLKENYDHFEMQHPNGSRFKVAKRGLDSKTLEKIRSLCAGGAVRRLADGGEVDGQDVWQKVQARFAVPAPTRDLGPDITQQLQQQAYQLGKLQPVSATKKQIQDLQGQLIADKAESDREGQALLAQQIASMNPTPAAEPATGVTPGGIPYSIERFAAGGEVDDEEETSTEAGDGGSGNQQPDAAPVGDDMPGDVRGPGAYRQAAQAAPAAQAPVWDPTVIDSNGQPVATPEAAPAAAAAPPTYGPPAPAFDPFAAPEKKARAELDAARRKAAAGEAQALAGIQGQALAKSQEGQQEAAAYEQQQAETEQAKRVFQQTHDQITAQNEQLYQDISTAKIDPNRFWADKSTGQRISAAIGIALGAVGGAMLHTGRNDALEIINQAVDREMQAQKENVDNKKSLLNMNMQRLRDADAAWDVTKSQILTATQAKVARAAALGLGPEAKAEADRLQGQLRMQSGQLAQQAAATTVQALGQARQTEAIRQVTSQLAQGVPGYVDKTMVPPDVAKRMIQIPTANGVITRLANNEKDAEEFKKSQFELGELNRTVSMMKQQRDQEGRAWLPNGVTNVKAQAMRSKMITSLRNLEGLNRLTDTEVREFEKRIPDVGAIMKSDTAVQTELELLQQDIQTAALGKMRQYLDGAPVSGFTPKK